MLRRRSENQGNPFILPYEGEYNGEGGAGGGTVDISKSIQDHLNKQLESNIEITPPPEIASVVTGQKKDANADDIIPPVIPPVTPPITPTPSTTDFKYNPIWDHIKKGYEEANGEGSFKMPEGLSTETENEKFLEFMADNYIGNPETFISQLSPKVQEIVRASLQDPNFEPTQYVQQRNQLQQVLAMPNGDFLKALLKNQNGYDEKENPQGWTDDQINAHVDKMDPIERDKQAIQAKVQYRDQVKTYEDGLAKTKQEQFDKEFEQTIQKQDKEIATLIDKVKTKKDFAGIEFSDAEKTQFLKDLPGLLKINPKTKTFPVFDMLRSDDYLVDVAAFLWKGNKGIRDHIDKIKEDGIANLWEKLRLNPINQSGTIISNQGAKIPTAEDFV